jgi:hypothetical protein
MQKARAEMNKLVFWTNLAFVITLAILAFSIEAFAQGKREDLSRLPIRNFQMEADNIGLILSRFSDQYNIPIGFEVATDDDLSITNTITIDIKDGTVQGILTSIVNQNPVYTWEVKDDVVNVFPRERNRDVLLKDVLETRLERISIDTQTTRFTLRQALCENVAVKKLLSLYSVRPANETFTSRDFGKVGRDFAFVGTNVSVATVLNHVIRNSPTKYWIIMRYGNKKQYLVLNL